MIFKLPRCSDFMMIIFSLLFYFGPNNIIHRIILRFSPVQKYLKYRYEYDTGLGEGVTISVQHCTSLRRIFFISLATTDFERQWDFHKIVGPL